MIILAFYVYVPFLWPQNYKDGENKEGIKTEKLMISSLVIVLPYVQQYPCISLPLPI